MTRASPVYANAPTQGPRRSSDDQHAEHTAAAGETQTGVTRQDDILARYVELLARPFWSDASPVDMARELDVTVRDVLRAEARYLQRRGAHRLIGFYENIIARRGLDLDWYGFGITLGEDFDSRLASMPQRVSEDDRWREFVVALMAEKEAA